MLQYIQYIIQLYYTFLKIFNIYLVLRERLSANREEWREREGQMIQSRLCSERSKRQCGAQIHEPQDHDRSRSQTLN